MKVGEVALAEVRSSVRWIAAQDDPILVTGANGFVGSRVVLALIERGFRDVRCFVRPSSRLNGLEPVQDRVRFFQGTLLSPEDCLAATHGVKVIFHLAAGRGEKSFPDAFINSVVTTRNLLDACVRHDALVRFTNVSSFAVYADTSNSHGHVLDEQTPVEGRPDLRGEAYCFAKVKQDEIVREYGERFGVRYVIVRPGYVIGPGKQAITGRVGIDTFGVFLHLGGSNTIPFTYVDNCADAIVLAGLTPGVDGEVFNVVDDDLPSSRRFLRLYKREVRNFRSFYVPHFASYALCHLWEKYSHWSQGQLPPVFNRRRWRNNWKKTGYSNQKLKQRVGWKPCVSMEEGLERYFEGCRAAQRHA